MNGLDLMALQCHECITAERKAREEAERPLREAQKEAADDRFGVVCPLCREGSSGCSSCSDGWVRYPRHMLNRMRVEDAARNRRRRTVWLLIAAGGLLVAGVVAVLVWLLS